MGCFVAPNIAVCSILNALHSSHSKNFMVQDIKLSNGFFKIWGLLFEGFCSILQFHYLPVLVNIQQWFSPTILSIEFIGGLV
jgi:hypothetical protein